MLRAVCAHHLLGHVLESCAQLNSYPTGISIAACRALGAREGLNDNLDVLLQVPPCRVPFCCPPISDTTDLRDRSTQDQTHHPRLPALLLLWCAGPHRQVITPSRVNVERESCFGRMLWAIELCCDGGSLSTYCLAFVPAFAANKFFLAGALTSQGS